MNAGTVGVVLSLQQIFDIEGIRMKKIMLIDEFKMVNYAGGIEQVVCGFANDFVRRGYEVTLVSLDREKGVPFFPLDERVSFINLCYDVGGLYFTPAYFWSKLKKEIFRLFYGPNLVSKGKKVRDPKKEYYYNEFKRRLGLAIERMNPDVIITSGATSTVIVLEIIKKMKRCTNGTSMYLLDRRPIVISTCHTDARNAIEHMDEKQYQALREASCVTVLMQSYVEQMKRIGVSSVYWMPNAVHQVFFDRKADLSVCRHKIVYVGRMEEQLKRPHLLIQAFGKIAKQYPKWSLHLYGEQSNVHYVNRLKKLANEYQITDRVIFEGPSNAIAEHLQEADIFAFPSSFEGFGIALTEAMAVGLPAIGYRSCDAVNELIIDGQNGFLCEDGVDDFANKLAMLMDDQALRIQMGENARQAMKIYSPQRILDRWESLLHSLTATH